MIDQLIFFLGGRDAEMCEIRKILEKKNLAFHDKTLSWGAKLSNYKDKIKTLSPEDTPVFIELSIDLPLPEKAIIVIDHHCQKAGQEKPTSIEQVAELLGISLNRWQQLIAVNDRAHIKGLKAFGASEEEIERIRTYDRNCQGVTEEEEERSKEICAEFKSQGVLEILEIPFEHTSPITDRLFGRYQNLLIIAPKSINFFGDGKIVKTLGEKYKGSWYGGDLPEDGFWGIKKKSQQHIDEIKTFLRRLF